jgi:hypothetical protein
MVGSRSKGIIPCPFSKKTCKECAIFRGRHIHLCTGKPYRISDRETTGASAIQHRSHCKTRDQTFGMPRSVVVSPTVICNVEDIVEGQESHKLKKKGGKHDT